MQASSFASFFDNAMFKYLFLKSKKLGTLHIYLLKFTEINNIASTSFIYLDYFSIKRRKTVGNYMDTLFIILQYLLVCLYTMPHPVFITENRHKYSIASIYKSL